MNTSKTVPSSHPPLRRLHGDSGGAVVELAIALPILIFLFVSVVEYGLAYSQVNQLESTLLISARTIGQQQKARLADYQGLQALSSGLSGMRNTTIERAVVWNANTSTSAVPPGPCTSVTPGYASTAANGVSGSCNIYSRAQVNTTSLVGFPAGSSTATTCTSSWDSNWCPLARSNTDGAGDWVGLWVEIKFTSLTKFVPGGSLKMSRGAVYRLEPSYIGG